MYVCFIQIDRIIYMNTHIYILIPIYIHIHKVHHDVHHDDHRFIHRGEKGARLVTRQQFAVATKLRKMFLDACVIC